MKRPKLADVQAWAESHWGLRVVKNDPKSRGWWNGCWRTGWMIVGAPPGLGHSCRRFRSLVEIARLLKMPGS